MEDNWVSDFVDNWVGNSMGNGVDSVGNWVDSVGHRVGNWHNVNWGWVNDGLDNNWLVDWGVWVGGSSLIGDIGNIATVSQRISMVGHSLLATIRKGNCIRSRHCLGI